MANFYCAPPINGVQTLPVNIYVSYRVHTLYPVVSTPYSYMKKDSGVEYRLLQRLNRESLFYVQPVRSYCIYKPPFKRGRRPVQLVYMVGP